MLGKRYTAALPGFLFALLSFFSISDSQTPYSLDSLAVRAILDSNGLYSKRVDSLTIKEGGRITEFRITYMPEFKKLTADIGKLSKLRKLWLGSTSLTSIPKEIGSLTELEELNIQFANIKAIPPEISHCAMLRTLQFSSCHVETIPDEIGSLVWLDYLDLNYNALTTIPDAITNLTGLSTLNLRCNSISKIPDKIGKLSLLTALDLSYNKLSTVPKSIGNLNRLPYLILDHNAITEIPQSLYSLGNIHGISLSYNRLKEIPAGIGRLDTIQYLFLDHNQLGSLPRDIRNLVLDQRHTICGWGKGFYFCDTLYTLNLDSNNLCSVDERLADWIATYAVPDWRRMQTCGSTAIALLTGKNSGGGTESGSSMLYRQSKNAAPSYFDIRGRRINERDRNARAPGVYLLRGQGERVRAVVRAAGNY
jgi:Leucine-rich repeat (LRR) protein